MNINHLVVLVALLVVSVADPAQSLAQQSEPESTQTRQAPAMSRAVYEKIDAARELSDVDRFDAATLILEQLAADDDLSEYEQAYVLQFLGYCYHSSGNTPRAIEAYREALAIPSLELQARKVNLYTLAQLLVLEERYADARTTMQEWFGNEPDPAPRAHAFHGQIQYHLGDYESMIVALQNAIEDAERRGTERDEQWFALLSYGYFQLEDYESFLDVNKTLAREWPKKRYWMSVAQSLRELDNEQGFIAAYDAAYAQGLLTREPELVTMAQLYLQADVPLKAAQLLESAIEDGAVSESAKNLRLLAQAWTLAREDERSLAPLQRAAALDDDGELYVRLGNALLSLDRNSECVAAVENGLRKGGLRNPDYAQLSLGMCRFNLREYRQAISAFRQAAEASQSRATARQWIRAVELEIARQRELEKAEAHAVEQMQALERRLSGEAT